MNKYFNKKVIIDGYKFASKKEAKRYTELKILERNGDISNLELQKEFELQPKFKKNNKTFRKITYISDFYYYDKIKNKWIVEDTKGYRTKEYKIKYKLFEYKYQDLEINEL